MPETLELRWFYSGTIPPEVLDWFEQDSVGQEIPATRTDRYLQVLETDALGIKVREGRLEIKHRHGGRERVALHPQVVGRAESWRKWSFSLDATDGQLADPRLSSSAWIDVQKTRWLRSYQFLADGMVFGAPAGHSPEDGCNWEVSQVYARGQAGWTVGLEAFGPAVGLRRSLLSAADHILGLVSLPILRDECSFGYPSWLIRVMQSGTMCAYQE